MTASPWHRACLTHQKKRRKSLHGRKPGKSESAPNFQVTRGAGNAAGVFDFAQGAGLARSVVAVVFGLSVGVGDAEGAAQGVVFVADGLAASALYGGDFFKSWMTWVMAPLASLTYSRMRCPA